MKRYIPFAMLLALASCSLQPIEIDQPAVVDNNAPKKVYHAATESAGSDMTTKVSADQDMHVVWNAGDRISIFELTTYNHPYLFLGDDNDTAGDFEDQTPSGFHTGNRVPYVYAAYPYSRDTKMDNRGDLTMILPAEQSYKSNSFGIGANTMVAVSDGDFLAFKNVGGYISLRLYGDDVAVSSISLKANNGEKIAGKAKISIPLGGNPTAVMDATATDEVTIVCDPPVTIGATYNDYTSFWFVIPPVTFSGGFTITVTDADGGIFTKSTSNPYVVTRNQLDWMNALKVIPDYTAAAVQFADPVFEAYCLDNFDLNEDGILTRSEARLVEEIDVCTDNISSLGGIECFTNLKTLVCAGSEIATRSGNSAFRGQLESIELGSLILLEELDCSGNQLEELDLSGNPNLQSVDCTDNPMVVIHLAPGQFITDLETPEDTQIVHDWDDGIGPASFPDPEFRDYVFTYFDTNQNGLLSEAECNAVTTISVYTENIFSLEGIGVFQNLRSLTCYPNHRYWAGNFFYDSNNNEVIGSLTSLDLSNNTLLQYLYCQGNQLSSINVNNNAALIRLDCFTNQLTSLDISNNPVLSILQTSYNQLSNLDVSNNTALTILSCQHNQLTSLNVSNNTALRTLICKSNQLGALNVSNNNLLTLLDCGENQIDVLDISNNTELTDLDCCVNRLTSLDVNNNNALTYLSCFNNQLTSFDVSHNLALSWMDCSSSTMQYLYLATGQEITTLSKHDNTTIVYRNSDPAADEIWYTSRNGSVINPNLSGTGGFGDASVVSNTYQNGYGVIKFDMPLTTIGYSVFGFADFTSVTLPEGLTTIDSYAFGYCQRMTSITFPSTLTSIGAHAIRDCYSLTSVTIPESVTSIGSGAFDNCRSLQSFNGKFASSDHRWLIVNGTLVGFAPSGLTSVTIPAGVTEIGTYTFHFCSNLTSVIIPEGVTVIGGSAFAGCSSLASVTIPESMTTIGSGAFSNCYSMQQFNGKFASDDQRCLVVNGAIVGFAPAGLTDYTVPSIVTNIAYMSFYGCSSLTSITVPTSVTQIGEYAFTGCSSLNYIIFDSINPPAFNSIQVPTAIFDNTNNCPIYVPASSVDAYKHMQENTTWGGWAVYADRIQPRVALPEAVDLGLSVKWASFNLGATAPEEYGDYYAWGETQPYYKPGYAHVEYPVVWKQGRETGYNWGAYTFNPNGDGSIFTKYTGSDYATLQSEDDAANVNLGGSWRMPTSAELGELCNSNNCDWVWMENYNNSGIDGYLIQSKIIGYTDKSIFLPAAGDRNTTALCSKPSCYWSSSLNTTHVSLALIMVIESETDRVYKVLNNLRWSGCPIRPVTE